MTNYRSSVWNIEQVLLPPATQSIRMQDETKALQGLPAPTLLRACIVSWGEYKLRKDHTPVEPQFQVSARVLDFLSPQFSSYISEPPCSEAITCRLLDRPLVADTLCSSRICSTRWSTLIPASLSGQPIFCKVKPSCGTNARSSTEENRKPSPFLQLHACATRGARRYKIGMSSKRKLNAISQNASKLIQFWDTIATV